MRVNFSAGNASALGYAAPKGATSGIRAASNRRACRLENYLANRARLQRLAFYSKSRLHGIVAQRELSYERSDGYLVLLRDKREQAKEVA